MLVSASPPLLALAERLAARFPLERQEHEALLDLPAAIARMPANGQIVAADEAVEHAYVVLDGLVGQARQTRRGEQQITALYLPGETACLEAILAGGSATPLTALAPSALLVIPVDALRRAERRHPELARAFWRECQYQARISAEWLLNIGRRRATARTAHLFCELAWRSQGQDHSPRTRFPLPARQSHLADVLALTTVHLNRTLRVLREEGLASFQARELHIHDWHRLGALADFDPSYLS